MNEYELQDIWKNNLREFNDVMRLDSIIIRAMQEAVKEAQSKQCNIPDVSEPKVKFPDPYKDELYTKKIAKYASINEEYRMKPETIGHIMNAAIDWYINECESNSL